MSRFVLDASVAVAWCFEDETNAIADHALSVLESGAALVPLVWAAEVGNALMSGERRGRITSLQIEQSLEVIATLDITTDKDNVTGRLLHLLQVARSHRLSLYDSIYLDLAMRERLALATVDSALARAAEAVGVALV
ncbi:MAG: type II toxin-antitoxin system VapC family toxin [Bryobacteraceae bacterium]